MFIIYNMGLSKIDEFDWDDGNRDKNLKLHNVTNRECEEVFINEPLLINDDEKHSQDEKRYIILGKTNQDRNLTLIVTIRNKKIRVISARDQSKNERKVYEKQENTNTEI